MEKRRAPYDDQRPLKHIKTSTPTSGTLVCLDGKIIIVKHQQPVQIGDVTLQPSILPNGSLRLTTLPQTTEESKLESMMSEHDHEIKMRQDDIEHLERENKGLCLQLQQRIDVSNALGQNHGVIGQHLK